jgi:hypothetical protein
VWDVRRKSNKLNRLRIEEENNHDMFEWWRASTNNTDFSKRKFITKSANVETASLGELKRKAIKADFAFCFHFFSLSLERIFCCLSGSATLFLCHRRAQGSSKNMQRRKNFSKYYCDKFQQFFFHSEPLTGTGFVGFSIFCLTRIIENEKILEEEPQINYYMLTTAFLSLFYPQYTTCT